jgi:hypothetical protein
MTSKKKTNNTKNESSITLQSLSKRIDNLRSGQISVVLPGKRNEIALELSKGIRAVAEMMNKEPNTQLTITNCVIQNSTGPGISVGGQETQKTVKHVIDFKKDDD